ncbi:MAG: isochorismatase family protein [Phycisphaerales bacterium]|nr:MAG: isochorismatase family protein [Phycisphaerales bacterium]
MRKDTVFWDVDTQFDFMRPEGKLYVPGAETIIDKVSEVRRFALDAGYSIIADVDWHSADDDEISDTPDFERTFPPHCMAGEPGSERVGYLGELPIEYIPIEKMNAEDLRGLVAGDQFHVVIKKDELDVFSNPNTGELVKMVEPKKVIVFGVALDFCVSCVVHGLSRFADIELCVLTDAVKGLGVKPEPEIFDEFKRIGIEVAEFGALKENLQCG